MLTIQPIAGETLPADLWGPSTLDWTGQVIAFGTPVGHLRSWADTDEEEQPLQALSFIPSGDDGRAINLHCAPTLANKEQLVHQQLSLHVDQLLSGRDLAFFETARNVLLEQYAQQRIEVIDQRLDALGPATGDEESDQQHLDFGAEMSSLSEHFGAQRAMLQLLAVSGWLGSAPKELFDRAKHAWSEATGGLEATTMTSTQALAHMQRHELAAHVIFHQHAIDFWLRKV